MIPPAPRGGFLLLLSLLGVPRGVPKPRTVLKGWEGLSRGLRLGVGIFCGISLGKRAMKAAADPSSGRAPALALHVPGQGQAAAGAIAVPGQGQEEEPVPLPTPETIQVRSGTIEVRVGTAQVREETCM